MRGGRGTPAIVILVAVLACADPATRAGGGAPGGEAPLVVTSSRNDLRLDGQLLTGAWTLSDEGGEDALTLPMVRSDQTRELCFVGAEEERCLLLHPGDIVRFDAVLDGRRHPIRVEAVLTEPRATFSDDYVAAHRGRIVVELPPAYELVNVAIALTDFARATPGLVAASTAYHRRVLAHFGRFSGHPLIDELDGRLSRGDGLSTYYEYKHNALALEVDAEGRVVRSSVYNRIDGSVNRLVELLPLLNDFADRADFQDFLRSEAPYHERSIAWYGDDAGLDDMLSWLRARFPDGGSYDGYKVVFSPLVGDNQAARRVEGDAYVEWQMHVNFPHPADEGGRAVADDLERGVVVFTELNHGFLDPAAAAHEAEIDRALADLAAWGDEGARAAYATPLRMFDEYMNWGLVQLWFLDRADPAVVAELVDRIDRTMVQGRGFTRFDEFSAFLREAYRSRADGETVADLLPRLVAWFEGAAG